MKKVATNFNRNNFLEDNDNKLVKKLGNEIFFFLKSEEEKGVNLEEKFNSEEDDDYSFLRKINAATNFFATYKNEKNKLFIHELTIDKPIGNLYRENHVLVLLKDSLDNFVMGQKVGFYPPNMTRMLGGGLKNDEDPLKAISREIREETKIQIAEDDLFYIGRTITKANTIEGILYMNVYIFGAKLNDTQTITASDDITGIVTYNVKEFKKLIDEMPKLQGEFRNEKFYYLFNDWGRIYGFIHKVALENFTKHENTLSI